MSDCRCGSVTERGCLVTASPIPLVYGTPTLLFPFWRACFRVVKAGRILVPDPATVHCGQRYDLKGPNCQVAENLWGKNLKGDLKNLFWTRKIRSIMTLSTADLRVLAHLCGREIYARPGNSGCSVYRGGAVGQLLHAYIFIQARMHSNSNTEV